MEAILHYAIPVALAAVAVVLLLGLWNMLRGGSPGRSQTLMRWRVGLQFGAIIIIMAALYFSH
jgi:hypothetical protein